jgi:hypothetical protein
MMGLFSKSSLFGGGSSCFDFGASSFKTSLGFFELGPKVCFLSSLSRLELFSKISY